MKTGIHVHTKCSCKELSQSGVCDDVFYLRITSMENVSSASQRKLLALFLSPWVNEDSDLVKCHAHASIWRVAEGASGVSVL